MGGTVVQHIGCLTCAQKVVIGADINHGTRGARALPQYFGHGAHAADAPPNNWGQTKTKTRRKV